MTEVRFLDNHLVATKGAPRSSNYQPIPVVGLEIAISRKPTLSLATPSEQTGIEI